MFPVDFEDGKDAGRFNHSGQASTIWACLLWHSRYSPMACAALVAGLDPFTAPAAQCKPPAPPAA